MQAGLLLIFLIPLFSNYSVPITKIEINYDILRKIAIQKASIFGHELVEIPFSQVKINFKWKLLLNYYKAVIEIRNHKNIIAVLPIKNTLWDKDEVDRLIDEIIKLSKEYLDEKQFYVAKNFYSFMPPSFKKEIKNQAQTSSVASDATL